MTTTLKKTDVVVVGLGGAGGIAVLPLAEAGLEVVALEAGLWHSPRDTHRMSSSGSTGGRTRCRRFTVRCPRPERTRARRTGRDQPDTR